MGVPRKGSGRATEPGLGLVASVGLGFEKKKELLENNQHNSRPQ